MHRSPRPFEQFLQRVRRRLILGGAKQPLAQCVTAGTALAAPLVIALRWEQRPIEFLLILLAAAVLLAAATLTIRRRPTLAAVATIADERLRLCDLLSTALALAAGEGQDDPALVRMILSLADQRTAAVAPGRIVLASSSQWRWNRAAVALAVLLVAAGVPLPLPRSGTGTRGDANAAVLLTPPSPLAGDVSALEIPPPTEPASHDATRSQTAVESTSVAESQGKPATAPRAAGIPRNTVGSPDSGIGYARSGAPPPAPPPPIAPADRPTVASSAPMQNGTDDNPAAGGNARTGPRSAGGAPSSADQLAPAASPLGAIGAVPPAAYGSSAPPTQTVPTSDRSVPAQYQPLLHDYFDASASESRH
jgi:hypothetical protein